MERERPPTQITTAKLIDTVLLFMYTGCLPEAGFRRSALDMKKTRLL